MEEQVGQDRMDEMALWENPGHQVMVIQDYLVLKVTQVFLDLKDFLEKQVPRVMVYKAPRENKDLKEIRDLLAYQEFLDDQDLQEKHRDAVLKVRLVPLVQRVSQVHQGFQVSQGAMVLPESQDTQALKA